MEIRFHNKQRKYDLSQLKTHVDAAVRQTLSFLKIDEVIDPEKFEISLDVSFISKKLIRELNLEHRGIDRATDILSFPAFEWSEAKLKEDISVWLPRSDDNIQEFPLGDIVLCLEVIEQQAEDFSDSPEDELFFMTVHGVLHLLGFDHELPDDEKLMKDVESDIIKSKSDSKVMPVGYVALSGRPNVGKSTLLNYISGMTLAITSPKPQTTRDLIRSVYNDDSCQIAFLDTPGFHKPKSGLGRSMLKSARVAIRQSDVVLLMIEATFKPFVADLEREIIAIAEENNTPVILLINKTDTAVKENILPLIAAFNAAHPFAAIIPISALEGEGVDELIVEIKKLLPVQEAIFKEGDETNISERKLTSEMIRREVLLQTQKEVPFGVAVVIEEFTEESANMDTRQVYISAVILCDKPSHKSILVGHGGQKIKSIGSKARAEISEMLQARVHLDLFVKVRPNWMNRPQDLAELGFEGKKIELP